MSAIPQSNSQVYQGGGGDGAYMVPNGSSALFSSAIENLNDAADKQVSNEQYSKGIREQTDKAPTTTITDPNGDTHEEPVALTNSPGLGISSRAYAQGVNASFVIQKRNELENTMLQLEAQNQGNPQGFKEQYNAWLPQFRSTMNAATQPHLDLAAQDLYDHFSQKLNSQEIQKQLEQTTATFTDRITTTADQMNQVIQSGTVVTDDKGNKVAGDPVTGKSLTEIMADNAATIEQLSKVNPQHAQALAHATQQQIREAEYAAHFRSLPTPEAKQEFLQKVEHYAFNDTNLPGETLTAENRRRTVSQLRTEFSNDQNMNSAEAASVENDLKATHTLLMDGVGADRDLTPLLARARAVLPPKAYGLYAEQLTKAKEWGQQLSAVQSQSIPDQIKTVDAAEAAIAKTKADFNSGIGNSQDMVWEIQKRDALVAMVQKQQKEIQNDPWSILNNAKSLTTGKGPHAPGKPVTADSFDLTTQDGVDQARNYIATKTGLPTDQIPLMSKQGMEQWKANFNSIQDPTTRAMKLISQRQQMGDANFENFMHQADIDPALLPVAYSEDPSKAATIMTMQMAGKEIEKNASTIDKQSAERAYTEKFGNAFSLAPDKDAAYKEAFIRMSLELAKRGDSNAQQTAFNYLTTGKQIQNINGKSIFIPNSVDPTQLAQAVQNVNSNLAGYGLALPPDVTANDVNLANFTPSVVGNKLIFVGANGQALRLRTDAPNVTTPLAIDLSTYDVSRSNVAGKPPASWNAPKAEFNDGSAPVAPNEYGRSGQAIDYQKGMFNAITALSKQDKQNLDPAASQFTRKPGEQAELQVLSTYLAHGEVPAWAHLLVGKIASLDPGSGPAGDDNFARITKAWADQQNRDVTLPTGAKATPLEAFAALIAKERNRRN